MEILRAATLASKSPFLVCCVRVEKSFEQFPSLVSAFLRPCSPSKGEPRPFVDRHEVDALKKIIESKRAFAMEKKISLESQIFLCSLAIDFLFDDRVGLFRCDPLCASGIQRLTYHRGRIIIRRAAVSPEFRPVAFLVRPFLFLHPPSSLEVRRPYPLFV